MADVRYHLDEHIDPAIAVALRRFGIDVTTTVELRMRGLSDTEHLAFAKESGRVIVTDDTDFLVEASRSTAHSGVVFCYRSKHTVGDIVRFLIMVHGVCTAEELCGKVEFVFD